MLTFEVKYSITVGTRRDAIHGEMWRAHLVCHCSDKGEHTALEAPDFNALLQGVKFALLRHEEEDEMKATKAATLPIHVEHQQWPRCRHCDQPYDRLSSGAGLCGNCGSMIFPVDTTNEKT